MNYDSIYYHRFARVAACSQPTALGDPHTNANSIATTISDLNDQGVAVVVFPELSLTGASLQDYTTSLTLLKACEDAVRTLCTNTDDTSVMFAVGAPVAVDTVVINAALIIHHGQLRAIVPQTYVTSTRSFISGDNLQGTTITYAGQPVPITNAPLTADHGITVGFQIGHDATAITPMSTHLALQGASLIATLDASPACVGVHRQRATRLCATATRENAVHIYANAGVGESTNENSWDGQTLICEPNSQPVAGPLMSATGGRIICDVDLNNIDYLRRNDAAYAIPDTTFITESALLSTDPDNQPTTLLNPPLRSPYIPTDPTARDEDLTQTFDIQVHALARRLTAVGSQSLIIGVSGGLDSTHALIVAVKTMDYLTRPRSDIKAYTMPGFATSDHTKSNAYKLCEALGIECHEIDIRPAATQMLADMGHPFADGKPAYDITFENVQAGLRTDYLFRLANHLHGFVLGTGDLSELALGWCTYGVGDHMSHYAVNAGIPKTMMQHLIRHIADTNEYGDAASQTLYSILDTEISPELIPADDDHTPQSTQSTIGPYELHDYFLYYFLRGYRPATIAYMARQSFDGAYDFATIITWLRRFLWRFVTQQFKRTALPNGPQVLPTGSVSPRSALFLPSDATPDIWLHELDHMSDVAGWPSGK